MYLKKLHVRYDLGSLPSLLAYQSLNCLISHVRLDIFLLTSPLTPSQLLRSDGHHSGIRSSFLCQSDALKALLDDNIDNVTIGQLSCIRRLMFDAQTLCASQITTRIQHQKGRLQGLEFTGPLECSHASYACVARMLEGDVPMYLEPHRFTTRASEVSREKPSKELVLDNVNLTVKDVVPKDKCQISNELQLHQALTRRAPAPPGFKPPNMEQIFRTDRAGWIKMAEKVLTLKRKADGTLPLDHALAALPSDPAVMFHLVPLPLDRASVQSKADNRRSDETTKPIPIKKKDKPKGKGRGKGVKGKPVAKGKMPTELIGLHQQDKSGRRMCYNFNMQKGCDLVTTGQSCPKGMHSCMKCFGSHSAFQCNATVA